jgi:hypothetical protein
MMQNFKRNIVFLEKRKKIFRRKLAKIAENCDHNIDPRIASWYIFKPKIPIWEIF